MLWHTPYWSKLLLETSGGRFLITWQRYSICRERISFLTVLRSVFSAKWHAGRRLFKPLRIYLFTSSAYLLMLAFLQPLFMACRLGASWEISLTLIQKASFFRVSLDDVCRNSLVSALVQGNQILAAGKLAQSTSNFNSILMSLSKGLGKGLSNLSWPVTLQMLQRMQELIVEPNLGTFKAAASASKDRPDLILPIFQNLKLSQLDQISLNMLVSSLERCPPLATCPLVSSRAKFERTAWHPDLAAYNSAISALCESGTLEYCLATGQWDSKINGRWIYTRKPGFSLLQRSLELGFAAFTSGDECNIFNPIESCFIQQLWHVKDNNGVGQFIY